MAILTMKKKLSAIAIALLTVPMMAHAVWFQGQGSATIKDGEVDQARHEAVQNALLGLMYKGGASIRSVQVVKSGVLASDKLTVRTNGEIHDMQVMREKRTDDTITVTVRADIFPMKTCNKDNYAKTMMIGPITIRSRQQAQMGGIYQLGKTLSQQLFQQLQLSNRRIDARQLMTTPIASLSDYNDQNSMLEVARSLSAQNDVQYVMFGTIDDLSNYTTSSTSQLTGVTDTTHHRSFRITIYVVDGIKGDIVFSKSYSTNQEWDFSLTMKVSPDSDMFWSSKYGKAVQYVMKQAVQDVQVSLYCKQTLANVVGIDNNQLIINLGQRDGVQEGDAFHLMRTRYLLSHDGAQSSPIFNQTQSPQFKVVSVQTHRSVLQADHYSDMANIQLRDILIASSQNKLRANLDD
ncbi:flagellar assembly protein T N-terminal domain-containing protein [Celerinatantimonas sp. MCCC 1A17872]|uniref:flagellar assembly protein T N-terminal domain-containing protein n=1 Tax=Celerinatantimonas sp. MCCC 1A17872 TaxID=3177514 RepID=UPI0038C351E5